MDYSQYIRKKQEAANVYLARRKTVDASLLTSNRAQVTMYGEIMNGLPKNVILNGISPPVTTQICCNAADSSVSTNNLSQQQARASRAAGGVIANDVKYSTASPGIQLKTCSEVHTILHAYNNNTPAPSLKCDRGFNRYFPSADSNSSCGTCKTDKTTASSG